MRPDFLWQHFEGRDHEGERFSHDVLIHGSGRILAKVYLPIGADGYQYEAVFYAGSKDLRDNTDQRFVDLDSARRHCEVMLADYGIPPQPDPPVTSDAPRKRHWLERIFSRDPG